tara:strand:- start:586 stop:849 length:264 start_codon:yes stop_codon:yes gene_type:complete
MEKNFTTYAIISIDDLPKVDFGQVGETSADTIRKSLDLTKFVLKWNVEPNFIYDETIIPIECLNHEQTLELMATDEWSQPIEEEGGE